MTTTARFADDDDRRIERLLRTPAAALAAAQGGFDRRRFLQGALALGAVSALDLRVFADRAGAAPLPADQNILVIVELTGGNDGLNLLAPTTDGRYQDLRRGVAIAPGSGHAIEPGWELHPAMPKLAARHRAGSVAFIESVAETTADHSHFLTMARVMAGTPTPGPTPTGWAGRFLDGASPNVLAGVNVDNGGVPLHMIGARRQVTGLTVDKRLFGASTSDGGTSILNEAFVARGNDAGIAMMDRSRSVFADSVRSARQIEPVYDLSASPDRTTHKMRLLASTINLDIGTQVLSTRLGGFDTHADQPRSQRTLLGELDGALEAFFTALSPRFADRVAVLVFSEFGRRVAANASSGTDHGVANTWFIAGNRVRGGRYGVPADLRSLTSRGDLPGHVDIRSVYATVIGRWLGGDDRAVLGGNWETLDLFRPATTSSGPAPTVPPRPTEPAERYVDAVHRLFLGRPASATEIQRWKPYTSAAKRSTITRALAVSDEWAGVRVDELYRTVLGRGADAAGRRSWVGAIAAGTRLEDVAAGFYASSEYFARAGGSNAAFVQSLYERILERTPDRAGLDAWIRALDHGASRRKVAAGFYASIESRRQRVTTLYREVLGRRPDATGMASWSNYLANNGDVTLAALLASSDEFFNRAQR